MRGSPPTCYGMWRTDACCAPRGPYPFWCLVEQLIPILRPSRPLGPKHLVPYDFPQIFPYPNDSVPLVHMYASGSAVRSPPLKIQPFSRNFGLFGSFSCLSLCPGVGRSQNGDSSPALKCVPTHVLGQVYTFEKFLLSPKNG